MTEACHQKLLDMANFRENFHQYNHYNILIRYDQDTDWFKELKKYVVNQDCISQCNNCRFLFVFFVFLWFLTFFSYSMCILGNAPVHAGTIALLRYIPCRIKDAIASSEDLEKLTLTYRALVVHLLCITPPALLHFYHSMAASDGLSTHQFHSSFYAHPNIRLDGWHEFLDRYFKALEDEKVLARPEVPEVSGFDPPFWNSSSQELLRSVLWPPKLFNSWIEQVKKGEELALED